MGGLVSISRCCSVIGSSFWSSIVIGVAVNLGEITLWKPPPKHIFNVSFVFGDVTGGSFLFISLVSAYK